MRRFNFILQPKTAFATPLQGDTLFGQCCWALRHLYGESRLTDLLTGYTDSRPFMVLSDVLPGGFIARPTVPAELLGFATGDATQRKQQKSRQWFPEAVLTMPLNQWADNALSEKEMMSAILKTDVSKLDKKDSRYYLTEAQDHNSLNRQTGTTGSDSGFAPFQRQTFWYHPGVNLKLTVELDTERLTVEELLEVLSWIGWHGYGKEASCGLGKFEVTSDNCEPPPVVAKPDAWLTLAACAPQGLNWRPQDCYYQVFTRFGRHGDIAVHQPGGPFKNPALLAAPFAVLTPADYRKQGFTGQGIGGVSNTIKATVQQGYAPVYPVCLETDHD